MTAAPALSSLLRRSPGARPAAGVRNNFGCNRAGAGASLASRNTQQLQMVISGYLHKAATATGGSAAWLNGWILASCCSYLCLAVAALHRCTSRPAPRDQWPLPLRRQDSNNVL